MPGCDPLSGCEYPSNVTHTIFSLDPFFIENPVCSPISHASRVLTYYRIAIPTAFKILFLFRERNSEKNDQTSTRVDIVLSSILVVTTTIMATTLPFMNPVMGHLQPGWSTGAVRLGAGVEQRPESTLSRSRV